MTDDRTPPDNGVGSDAQVFMQVIGSGFGRTGTMSLQAALQQLGFAPCYHMMEVIRRPAHVQAWLRIARGEPPDFPKLFADFKAAVDFPACIFYAQLLQEFPDAKVVHTVRDRASWYRSTYETIYQARHVTPRWMRRMSRYVGGITEMTNRLCWDGLFEGRFEEEHRALEIFDEFTARVRASVPADKLLVYNVRDGWGPLCAFLNVPVPATPFPHVNDRASMVQALRFGWWLTRVGPAVLALLGIGLLSWWLQNG